MKLKNSSCDKSQTNQIVMKLKKLNLWQNSSTQIVMKLKNWYSEKTQNSKYKKIKKKTQIVTKLKKTQKHKLVQKSNCDKTQIVTKVKLWQ